MKINFTIQSVNTSEQKGTQKHPVAHADLIPRHGLSGDAHAGPHHRQVSFLAGEAIDALQTLMTNKILNHGDFGENIITRGIDWTQAQIGAHIHINDAELEITQIGKECHTRCAIYDAAGHCIMPEQGIFAKVLKGGSIHAGDSGYYNF